MFKITHSKSWFNDDDPGVLAPGWTRMCNLDAGDFNNDLTISDTWTCTFSGKRVLVVAPRELNAGKIEILIDGKSRGIFDMSTVSERRPQQEIYCESDMTSGKHIVKIIHRGEGKVAIDAIVME